MVKLVDWAGVLAGSGRDIGGLFLPAASFLVCEVSMDASSSGVGWYSLCGACGLVPVLAGGERCAGWPDSLNKLVTLDVSWLPSGTCIKRCNKDEGSPGDDGSTETEVLGLEFPGKCTGLAGGDSDFESAASVCREGDGARVLTRLRDLPTADVDVLLWTGS